MPDVAMIDRWAREQFLEAWDKPVERSNSDILHTFNHVRQSPFTSMFLNDLFFEIAELGININDIQYFEAGIYEYEQLIRTYGLEILGVNDGMKLLGIPVKCVGEDEKFDIVYTVREPEPVTKRKIIMI